MTDPAAGPAAAGAEPLNTLLFAGSATIHRAAERRPFMVVFFKAELPKDAFVAYLGRLFFVYEALEAADDALASHPVVGVMHSPELHRRAALDRDLRALAGPSWRDAVEPSPATKEYVAAIERVRSSFPPGFVAHQWLRYLGNVLAQPVNLRIVEKAYGLTSEGTHFFRYDTVDDARAYLRSYHARMNSMPLDEEERAGVVEEARRAWQCQIDLTDELAADFDIDGPDAEETERFLTELASKHP